jgi:hypothetical protein
MTRVASYRKACEDGREHLLADHEGLVRNANDQIPPGDPYVVEQVEHDEDDLRTSHRRTVGRMGKIVNRHS